MYQKDVPTNIWSQYAKKSLFTILGLKHYSARKGKAKTKAARGGGRPAKRRMEGDMDAGTKEMAVK